MSIESDLDMIRPLDGLFLGQLTIPELEALNRLTQAGLADREYGKVSFAAPAGEPLTEALRSVLSHWREFGPEHGFDECIEMAGRALGLDAAPAGEPMRDALAALLNAYEGVYDSMDNEGTYQSAQAKAAEAQARAALSAAPAGEPAAAREIERLRAFAAAVMEDWPDVGLDGADLQELGIKHGLLELKMPKPTEPCGESCNCASYFSDDEWPEGIECYRLTALVTGASAIPVTPER